MKHMKVNKPRRKHIEVNKPNIKAEYLSTSLKQKGKQMLRQGFKLYLYGK